MLSIFLLFDGEMCDCMFSPHIIVVERINCNTAMEENRPGIVRDAVTGKTCVYDLFVLDHFA